VLRPVLPRSCRGAGAPAQALRPSGTAGRFAAADARSYHEVLVVEPDPFDQAASEGVLFGLPPVGRFLPGSRRFDRLSPKPSRRCSATGPAPVRLGRGGEAVLADRAPGMSAVDGPPTLKHSPPSARAPARRKTGLRPRRACGVCCRPREGA
jgi:hypothetical protein